MAPNKKKKRPEPRYLNLWVDVSVEYTRDPDEGDSWDIGDTTESLDSFGVDLGYDREKSHSHSESISEDTLGYWPSAGDTMYMVIQNHSDGCTFGHTDSAYRAVNIFKTRQEAEKWLGSPAAEKAEAVGYFGRHIGFEIEPVVVHQPKERK